jgi:hypothetical protein
MTPCFFTSIQITDNRFAKDTGILYSQLRIFMAPGNPGKHWIFML